MSSKIVIRKPIYAAASVREALRFAEVNEKEDVFLVWFSSAYSKKKELTFGLIKTSHFINSLSSGQEACIHCLVLSWNAVMLFEIKLKKE